MGDSRSRKTHRQVGRKTSQKGRKNTQHREQSRGIEGGKYHPTGDPRAVERKIRADDKQLRKMEGNRDESKTGGQARRKAKQSASRGTRTLQGTDRIAAKEVGESQILFGEDDVDGRKLSGGQKIAPFRVEP